MKPAIEALEARQLLSGISWVGPSPEPLIPLLPTVTAHRKVQAAGAPVVTGVYQTTINYHGLSIDITLDITYQKHGRVAGTLDTSSLPVIGPAHENFSGTVNPDRTFDVTFTGTAAGTANGTFASDLKSATVNYDLAVLGMHFSGTRTFTR